MFRNAPTILLEILQQNIDTEEFWNIHSQGVSILEKSSNKQRTVKDTMWYKSYEMCYNRTG